ncbi:interleukin-23 subunit alpha [Rhineura floridana]|uniref:interleukin-23 subunit alpha n=1 Tax=Rhineura floridana TaxID=261503 RepID=UPI002AC8938C|nr:interleukin-23 subunit alpha [Rhineura floridana]
MKGNSRNHWGICLLGLLLLVATSTGMRLPRKSNFSWQDCKDASQEILGELWKLRVNKPLVVTAPTIPFSQRIECRDNCDPDSLVNNKTHCLNKIHQGLRHYHELLVQFSNPELTTKLQNALLKAKCLLLLSKVGGNFESSSPVSPTFVTEWEKGLLQDSILWRLQSFAVVVARVFSHCAALGGDAN